MAFGARWITVALWPALRLSSVVRVGARVMVSLPERGAMLSQMGTS
jgi:hypothetical protein